MATVPEWTPRHRSGFPRPRCLPSTRLACPHPRVRPGCPALSCLQSHMPGAVLGPSWPLASPFPGRHSRPALAAPRALLTAPPPPLLQRRPHILLGTTGTVAVCVCTGWGPPRPRWSHEPAGEGQLLKRRLLRKPQSTLLKITARHGQAPAKALRNRTPCPARTPLARGGLQARASSFASPQPLCPSQGPAANLRTTRNHRWSVLPSLLGKLAHSPFGGYAEYQEGEGREGSRGRSPMPLQTQAQKGDRGSAHMDALQSCACLSPRQRAPSTCMPPLRPHPPSCPRTPPLRLSPPPQGPSQEAL